MLQLIQTPELRLVGGGMSATVFPRVEAWLEEDSDRWNAFARLKGRRSSRRFRSVVDFLLCDVVPSQLAPCLAFYAGTGPALRDLATPAQLRVIEAKLLLFLTLAHEAFVQQRRLSWTEALAIVHEIAA